MLFSSVHDAIIGALVSSVIGGLSDVLQVYKPLGSRRILTPDHWPFSLRP